MTRQLLTSGLYEQLFELSRLQGEVRKLIDEVPAAESARLLLRIGDVESRAVQFLELSESGRAVIQH